MKPTTAQVNQLLRLWKVRLHLNGWVIGWKWERQDTINHDHQYNCLADTDTDVAEYKALIRFDEDVNWTIDQFYSDRDFEETLVHELLHVRFAAAHDKVEVAMSTIGPFLPPNQLVTIDKLWTDATERYIEAARTIIMEAKW